MGCFLACLGFQKSRKKWKHPVKKTSPSAQQPLRYGRYVPLDSEFGSPAGPEITADRHISGYDNGDELREKRRGPPLSKIKKRVRFNLDVKVYEPIIPDEDYEEEEEEEEAAWESHTEPEGIDSLCHIEDSLRMSTQAKPSPANRYQNCRGDYEDEEFTFDENELSFDDSNEEAYDAYVSDSGDDEILSRENLDPVDVSEANGSSKLFGIDIRTRDRGRFVSNLLNPVENVTQWKAVKSKAQLKCRDEENYPVLKQEGSQPSTTKCCWEDPSAFKKVGSLGDVSAVNVSLSNWLGHKQSPKTAVQAKTGTQMQTFSQDTVKAEYICNNLDNCSALSSYAPNKGPS